MNMEIANTIHRQIGGNRFLVCTGSKVIRYDDNSITYKLTRNNSGANELKISYNYGLDLYDVEFSKHTYPKLNMKTFEWVTEKKKIIKTFKEIYCDMLEELFTETTGLVTRLF